MSNGKLIILLLLSGISSIAFAQEEFGKCETMMINYKWPDKRVISSQDASYIARLEPVSFKGEAKDRIPPRAYIYKLDENKYLLETVIDLEHDVFPKKAALSNSGMLVTYGERNTQTNIDKVFIYKFDGSLFRVISGDDVYSKSQLKQSVKRYEQLADCTPEKPWICWTKDPVISDSKLWILDTLDHKVSIDLQSGKVAREEASSKCKMFSLGADSKKEK